MPDTVRTIWNIFWTGKTPSRHLFYPICMPDYVRTILNIFWIGKTLNRHLFHPIGMPDHVRTIQNIFELTKRQVGIYSIRLACHIMSEPFWIFLDWQNPESAPILPDLHARSCPDHSEYFWIGKSPSRHLFNLTCMPDHVRTIQNIFELTKPRVGTCSTRLACQIMSEPFGIFFELVITWIGTYSTRLACPNHLNYFLNGQIFKSDPIYHPSPIRPFLNCSHSLEWLK